MLNNNDSFQNEIIGIIKQIVENQSVFEDKLNQVFENQSMLDDRMRQLLINDTALDYAMNNLKYEIYDEVINGNTTIKIPKIEDFEPTIEKIMQGKSLCRFGDGEFELMNGKERQKFQSPSPKLKDHLIRVFNSKDDNILIGIADNYGSLSKYNPNDAYDIKVYLTEEVRKQHYDFIDMDRTYVNAYITRPYAMYADNGTDAPNKRFDALRKIWQEKDILIIEGDKTRMGVGNDLFDNAGDIIRIICPAVGAYDKYDEILNAASNYSKGRLVLIALGPTATVLAYDLAKAGFWALDIGHIDLEYEWMLAGLGEKIDIPHKYTNEVTGGDRVSDIHDEDYEKQIVAKVL